MTRLILAMPSNEKMAAELATILGADAGDLLIRRFPDGESYLRVGADVAGRDAALVCTMNDPDVKLAQILFASDLLRESGSRSIGLIAPYLAYMRQDRRFESGEAITSRSFANLLSSSFDWLATVDPHLHRYRSLGEIYSIPAVVARSAPLLGDWIASNIANPLLIGPDSESEQWVKDAATRARAPHVTLKKERTGDRKVWVELPDLGAYRGRNPVLVDDIASSGTTLYEGARKLIETGFPRPACLIVHALLSPEALELLGSVTSRIISSDTIPHATNGVAIAEPLAATIRALTDGPGLQ